jgi:hypothetical protein
LRCVRSAAVVVPVGVHTFSMSFRALCGSSI